jgi:hypothetical protein
MNRREFVKQVSLAGAAIGSDTTATAALGEFKLDQRLFGTSPGPATYLKEPCLAAKGRSEYRAGLSSILRELTMLTSGVASSSP